MLHDCIDICNTKTFLYQLQAPHTSTNAVLLIVLLARPAPCISQNRMKIKISVNFPLLYGVTESFIKAFRAL